MINVDFIQKSEPTVSKPLLIAAMQDMGDVGSIVIDFINSNLNTSIFREVQPSYPAYVIDNGDTLTFQKTNGTIDMQKILLYLGEVQANHHLLKSSTCYVMM